MSRSLARDRLALVVRLRVEIRGVAEVSFQVFCLGWLSIHQRSEVVNRRAVLRADLKADLTVGQSE